MSSNSARSNKVLRTLCEQSNIGKGHQRRPGVFSMNTDTQQAPSGKGKLQVGDRAPDFTLPTQKTGESFHLHDMIGKSAIVLYFYPKDDTLGFMPGRVTYVIDKEGIVRHIFSSQFAPEKHIVEAIRVLQETI